MRMNGKKAKTFSVEIFQPIKKEIPEIAAQQTNESTSVYHSLEPHFKDKRYFRFF